MDLKIAVYTAAATAGIDGVSWQLDSAVSAAGGYTVADLDTAVSYPAGVTALTAAQVLAGWQKAVSTWAGEMPGAAVVGAWSVSVDKAIIAADGVDVAIITIPAGAHLFTVWAGGAVVASGESADGAIELSADAVGLYTVRVVAGDGTYKEIEVEAV